MTISPYASAAYNLTPNQITEAYNRAVIRSVTFTFNLIGTGASVYVAQARVRWRVQGTSTWTTLGYLAVAQPPAGAASQTNGYNIPANTFPNSDNIIEYQVEGLTNYASQTTPWSSSAYLRAVPAPETPVYTAPAAGATITAGNVTVTWTQTTQVAWRIQLLNGTTVEYDSGIVPESATRSKNIPAVVTPSAGRTIRLMTQTSVDGAWSQVDRAITVNTDLPGVATSTIATTADTLPTIGKGFRHRLGATPTFPAGTSATVDSNLWVRRVGDTGNGYRVANGSGGGGSNLRYWGLPNGNWESRVETIGAAGASAFSAWTAVTLPVNITGLFLHFPRDDYDDANGVPGYVHLPYNFEGAQEKRDPLVELLQFAGRRSPVPEWDTTAEARVYKVAKVAIKTADVADMGVLRRMVNSREPICLRDKRGRKVIGLLELGDLVDTFYGWEFSLTITETDYPADPLRDDFV